MEVRREKLSSVCSLQIMVVGKLWNSGYEPEEMPVVWGGALCATPISGFHLEEV